MRTRLLIHAGHVDQANALIMPMVRTDSPRWRVTMMQIVLIDLLDRDERQAGQWLDQIELLIPAGAINEQLLWGQAQFVTAQRLDDSERLRRSYSLIASLKDSPDFPSSGWLLLGVYEETNENPAQAEIAYRQALAIDSDQHQAANNLAMMLLKQGEIDQALQLAQQAVDLLVSAPSANYLDTLATVQVASGELALAAESLREAIRVDPQTARWYVNRANLLVELEDLDAARTCLMRMKQQANPIPTDDEETASLLAEVSQALGIE